MVSYMEPPFLICACGGCAMVRLWSFKIFRALELHVFSYCHCGFLAQSFIILIIIAFYSMYIYIYTVYIYILYIYILYIYTVYIYTVYIYCIYIYTVYIYTVYIYTVYIYTVYIYNIPVYIYIYYVIYFWLPLPYANNEKKLVGGCTFKKSQSYPRRWSQLMSVFVVALLKSLNPTPDDDPNWWAYFEGGWYYANRQLPAFLQKS